MLTSSPPSEPSSEAGAEHRRAALAADDEGAHRTADREQHHQLGERERAPGRGQPWVVRLARGRGGLLSPRAGAPRRAPRACSRRGAAADASPPPMRLRLRRPIDSALMSGGSGSRPAAAPPWLTDSRRRCGRATSPSACQAGRSAAARASACSPARRCPQLPTRTQRCFSGLEQHLLDQAAVLLLHAGALGQLAAVVARAAPPARRASAPARRG